MRDNIVIALLVLGLLIISFFLFFDEAEKNTHNQQANEATISTKEITEIENQIAIQEHLSNTDENSDFEGVIETFQQLDTVYDSDPVVDASLLINNNLLCSRHLSLMANKVEFTKFNKRFNAKLDDKQKKFYKGFYANCKKINAKHPEYHLADSQKLYEQRELAKATSLWGKIIKGEVLADELSDADIGELLSQNNLNILSDSPKYLKDYYQKVIHWDLEDALQNHQYDYVTHVRYYAHQLYICNIGADCSINSSIMANLCYLNSFGCGKTFKEYISQILTPGQQADIFIAYQYFQNKYN